MYQGSAAAPPQPSKSDRFFIITRPIEGAFQDSSVALEARKTDLTRVSVTVSGETAPAVDDGQNGQHDAARMPPRTGVCLAQSSTRLQSN